MNGMERNFVNQMQDSPAIMRNFPKDQDVCKFELFKQKNTAILVTFSAS